MNRDLEAELNEYIASWGIVTHKEVARGCLDIFLRWQAEQMPAKRSRKASDTSRQAARQVQPRLGSYRHRILRLLAWANHIEKGLTSEQIERKLEGKHQTISARLNEMEGVGWLLRSPETAVNSGGYAANPYLITAKGLDVLQAIERADG